MLLVRRRSAWPHSHPHTKSSLRSPSEGKSNTQVPSIHLSTHPSIHPPPLYHIYIHHLPAITTVSCRTTITQPHAAPRSPTQPHATSRSCTQTSRTTEHTYGCLILLSLVHQFWIIFKLHDQNKLILHCKVCTGGRMRRGG